MVVVGMAEAVTQAAMAVRVVTLAAALISPADTLADMAAISGTAVSGATASAPAGSRPHTGTCGFATSHKALRAPLAGAFFVLECADVAALCDALVLRFDTVAVG
jgi:hypothetical protein